MITLHTFGPLLGTPDASPFVMKAMLLLKLAGQPYREKTGTPFGTPLGFLPCIEDEGVRVGDSTLIRRHLERKYGIDFDAGLDETGKAAAWTIERMCEDHLYFGLLHMRWMDDANFETGVARIFASIPAPVRPMVKAFVRRGTRKRLHNHGLGRHEDAAIEAFAIRDVEALARLMGDRPFMMGDRPSGADATVFGMLAALSVPPLNSPIRDAVRGHANLASYCDRILERYFAP